MIDVAFPLKGQCRHLMTAEAENASWGRTGALPVRASSVESSGRVDYSRKPTQLEGVAEISDKMKEEEKKKKKKREREWMGR